MTTSAEVDEDAPGIVLHRISLQVDADGCPTSLSSFVVKAAIVFRTLYCLLDHQTICQMDRFMRAKPISGKKLALRAAKDRVCPIGMVKALNVF
jgi:hypothetical protein